MKIQITINGLSPMLQHNGRLANPLDYYTQLIKAHSGTRNKTDQDLILMRDTEARGSCWETEEGLIGVPNAALWRSIFDAAKHFKRGKDVARSLIFEDIVVPLTVQLSAKKAGKVKCEDFLADSADNIDYRPVKIMGRKTMRARPRVPAPWSSVHEMELNVDVIDLRNLMPIIERAGALEGIGDWRPMYGRFRAEVKKG